jgi:FlaA1/EpsC-like NDP-sugar epimerase
MKMRNRHLVASDLLASALSVVLAFSIRFEGSGWTHEHGAIALRYFLAAAVLRFVINRLLGLYQRIWSLASIAEMERVLAALVANSSATILFGAVVLPRIGLLNMPVPLGVLTIDALLMGAGIALPRFVLRLSQRRTSRWASRHEGYQQLPGALIIGAGSAGQIAARELIARPSVGFRPVGFLDDDRNKHGLSIGDLPVLGTSEDLTQVALSTGARFAVIAMPSASGEVIRGLMQRARGAGLETRIVPSLHEHIARETGATPVRAIRIEDLLQREPIMTDVAAVRSQVEGRVVLITGAGGSIGSELCRQLAAMNPAELVLLGRGENSIFEIQGELLSTFPFVKLTPVILDVRDRERMQQVMQLYRPVAVFHAAAHKHVPLMEANVLEALRNNVLGTKSVVDAALAADVPRLVLISTDKAVRPTSVMGASKRIAEQVVQLAARESGKAYVSVRFGNVLGSRGSVVPTFIKQIQAGGPVRVTHPEMRRYFMTIPEAVQLVLQAFVMGTGEEVFCLDMGEPVKIVDLAVDLISLMTAPGSPSIEIRFSGTRSGEKLYEEMFFDEEHAQPTVHPKVLRATGINMSEALVESIRLELPILETTPDLNRLRQTIDALVVDYAVEAIDAGEATAL